MEIDKNLIQELEIRATGGGSGEIHRINTLIGYYVNAIQLSKMPHVKDKNFWENEARTNEPKLRQELFKLRQEQDKDKINE